MLIISASLSRIPLKVFTSGFPDTKKHFLGIENLIMFLFFTYFPVKHLHLNKTTILHLKYAIRKDKMMTNSM